MASYLKNVAEYFTPVLKDSHFKERGVLTPEEFVLAGDQLVHSCPTWEWASGDEASRRPYLPADKQYLVTKRVPSMKRANTYATDAGEAILETGSDDLGDDGWLSTHADAKNAAEAGFEEIDAIAELGLGADDELGSERRTAKADEEKKEDAVVAKNDEVDVSKQTDGASGGGGGDDDDDDDTPDMEDFEEDDLLAGNEKDTGTLEDPTANTMIRVVEPEDNVVRTRRYDLSLTYDKYYQTPRLYLMGYDEFDRPLTPTQIMEDVSCDHANKTVTVENHPHTGVPHLSIHPCKHAHVMKRLMDQMREGADGKPGKELIVDRYLFLFLKFMSSVIPTIQYDLTIQM